MQLTESLVLLLLIAFVFRASYYYVDRQSHLYKIMCIRYMISDPVEVKVRCLFENVLAGCTVTESKCLRIT